MPLFALFVIIVCVIAFIVACVYSYNTMRYEVVKEYMPKCGYVYVEQCGHEWCMTLAHEWMYEVESLPASEWGKHIMCRGDRTHPPMV